LLRAQLHENEIRRVLGLAGSGTRVIEGLAGLDEPHDDCLYFINKVVAQPVIDALSARAGCIVIAKRGGGQAQHIADCVVLEVAAPRIAIARILEFIKTEGRQEPWSNSRQIAPDAVISPMAVVEGSVVIEPGVQIEPFCVIGPDVKIGSGSVVRSGARIFPHASIGSNALIGANAVIGTEGFGFVRISGGNKTRIPHLGGVIIGSQVEIGALAVIEAGTIEPTIIEDGAKIGDSAVIGHNALIEQRVSITPGVNIAGSAVVGRETWIGINSSVRNAQRVGAYSVIGMDVSVQQDLPDRTVARAPLPELRMRTKKPSK
jgi:UDP-3-O-[3-hydroxymyristoyl] glucosamine N-acyltransferase LpxD